MAHCIVIRMILAVKKKNMNEVRKKKIHGAEADAKMKKLPIE
jgi:hypothetical protein